MSEIITFNTLRDCEKWLRNNKKSLYCVEEKFYLFYDCNNEYPYRYLKDTTNDNLFFSYDREFIAVDRSYHTKNFPINIYEKAKEYSKWIDNKPEEIKTKDYSFTIDIENTKVTLSSGRASIPYSFKEFAEFQNEINKYDFSDYRGKNEWIRKDS